MQFPRSRIEGLVGHAQGLSSAQAAERLSRYGPNDIVETPSSGWRDILRDTARDPMVWFLAATALLFAWVGEITEAWVLASAMLPIAGMDAYLHRRTQATTEGLAGRLASQALVLRDGAAIDVMAMALVPSDLVVVSEGQPFPADGLIVAGENLQVDESALSGESLPVRKRAFAVGDARVTGDDLTVESMHWGAAGTRVLTGVAHLRIIYTGRETLYGQIVRSAQQGRHERTPLQRAIGNLVTVLIVVATIICLALAATRLIQGHGLVDALLSGVTLAIAALPEEFPIVFTFFLGLGVYRLARRQALVRRAVVVENIGRVTCICSDKTGTLTDGRLHLAHTLAVDGVNASELVRIAATAARNESGDPLDLLLLTHCAPIEGERIATFPFTEDRRREVAIARTLAGALFAAVKGAPEIVFAMTTLDDGRRAVWQQRVDELAAAGHKVIACANRDLDTWSGGEPDRDYRFAGLLAFEDPVREGVADAVAKAQAADIRVLMVTGDHPSTAAAIARELGIGGAGALVVVEGADLAVMLAGQGPTHLHEVDVIARAVPAQKLDLVRALQLAGEIVAVTGDGVNDVPALQGADVGIAMGERGTRAAREVAAIVLLDDNFRTIVRAIAEGRQLFRNLKLSFAYLLMMHLPLVLTAALIPFAGLPLLYLPIHIVWLELIIHPTALLVFQKLPESDQLEVVPRPAPLRFFDQREWFIIGAVGVIITLVIIAGYVRGLGVYRDIDHARTVALAALTVASGTLTAGLNGVGSRSTLVALTLTLGSALALVQIEPLARLLHLSPLHLDDWIIAAAGGLIAGAGAALIPRRQRPRRVLS